MFSKTLSPFFKVLSRSQFMIFVVIRRTTRAHHTRPLHGPFPVLVPISPTPDLLCIIRISNWSYASALLAFWNPIVLIGPISPHSIATLKSQISHPVWPINWMSRTCFNPFAVDRTHNPTFSRFPHNFGGVGCFYPNSALFPHFFTGWLSHAPDMARIFFKMAFLSASISAHINPTPLIRNLQVGMHPWRLLPATFVPQTPWIPLRYPTPQLSILFMKFLLDDFFTLSYFRQLNHLMGIFHTLWTRIVQIL